ncbi:hypothetical protein FNH85_06370 [Salmonella enterica subsp. salamae]|nr:hypothetical protein [Salmonella enterica subsp. salamae serovar Sofia]ECD9441310.1 hypothetical protein [Salmonella enterica subsp. salamae]EGX0283194.1 hypothetical protein [Salmonella enterica]MBA3148658.1 hypothetical protein [Salmonella enterica]SQH92785.1 Uncharacterised protein [Salmonella enterica subsp. salamae]
MRNLFKIASACLCVLYLSGCASTKSIDVVSTEKIDAPKVIAISGGKGLWVKEIQKRLRSKGFTIKRSVSQQTVIEKESMDRTAVYKDAATRYLLVLDGYAPSDSFQRCIGGGGYKFDYINAELVDLAKNETIFSYSNSGYSEGCPMGGTIFTDIENLMVNSWR